MTKHITIKVHGEVQGVFFRATARMQAQEFGLVGFAKNEDDESVLIEAEGEETDLLQFLEWCKSGPPAAEIEKVDWNMTNDLVGYRTFEIQ